MDPDRAFYSALGMGRGSVLRVWLDPRVWRNELRLRRAGYRHAARPTQDTLQLGGDAVCDARGVVTWVFRGRGPEDRPAIDEVVAAAARAARTSEDSGPEAPATA